MKIVIRAGGVGTRLWPMSRQDNSKQFQAIVNDKTLIRNTVDRIKSLLADEGDLFISVNQKMVEKLKKEIPELPDENIIAEPASRNTGPAICLESCILVERFGEDVVAASLPSDDYIKNEKVFCELLGTAEKFLEKNPEYIVTPGFKPASPSASLGGPASPSLGGPSSPSLGGPTYPDTGYSYIKAGESLLKKNGIEIFKVGEWVEKPEPKQCEKLVQSGKYFYHTGMYIWKLKTILDLFQKFQPKMYDLCKRAAVGKEADYAGLKKITIESAVTLKAPKIATVVSDQIGWSDLGKWHIIKDILSKQGENLTKGQVLALDTKNCLIYAPRDKLIAAVGLNDMIIVLTENALLVCPKEKSAEVKKIIEELEKKKMKKYL